MLKMQYEVAVINNSNGKTSMELKSYESREIALAMREKLVNGFKQNGFKVVEGSNQVERITLKLDVEPLVEFGLLIPPVEAPEIQILVRVTGVA